MAIAMSGWIDPDRMTNDYLSFDSFPSRHGHRIVVRDINDKEVELEVIAWQIVTNNKTGEVDVYPITTNGTFHPSRIIRQYRPNWRSGKAYT